MLKSSERNEMVLQSRTAQKDFFFPVEMLTSGYSQERQINGNE